MCEGKSCQTVTGLNRLTDHDVLRFFLRQFSVSSPDPSLSLLHFTEQPARVFCGGLIVVQTEKELQVFPCVSCRLTWIHPPAALQIREDENGEDEPFNYRWSSWGGSMWSSGNRDSVGKPLWKSLMGFNPLSFGSVWLFITWWTTRCRLSSLITWSHDPRPTSSCFLWSLQSTPSRPPSVRRVMWPLTPPDNHLVNNLNTPGVTHGWAGYRLLFLFI